jgi:hypothetical protein
MPLETPNGWNFSRMVNPGGRTWRNVFIDHLVLLLDHKTMEQTHLVVKWCGYMGIFFLNEGHLM